MGKCSKCLCSQCFNSWNYNPDNGGTCVSCDDCVDNSNFTDECRKFDDKDDH